MISLIFSRTRDLLLQGPGQLDTIPEISHVTWVFQNLLSFPLRLSYHGSMILRAWSHFYWILIVSVYSWCIMPFRVATKEIYCVWYMKSIYETSKWCHFMIKVRIMYEWHSTSIRIARFQNQARLFSTCELSSHNLGKKSWKPGKELKILAFSSCSGNNLPFLLRNLRREKSREISEAIKNPWLSFGPQDTLESACRLDEDFVS